MMMIFHVQFIAYVMSFVKHNTYKRENAKYVLLQQIVILRIYVVCHVANNSDFSNVKRRLVSLKVCKIHLGSEAPAASGKDFIEYILVIIIIIEALICAIWQYVCNKYF